ncbi:MAG: hypothetical protein C4581_03510 [Nitrospiraceae bacterium]|nr:MAG: hypothetical protein C4581_03510 [Nitrospiraceae bacterium]
MLSCFIVDSIFAAMNVQRDCQISAGPCIKEAEHEGLRVVFDIIPKPVSPMRTIVFSVTMTDKNGPVTDASVHVDLTMPGMFMGTNRPALLHKENGRYEGMGVIQTCPHGGKTWRADVGILRQGKTASVGFTFGVE